MGVKLYIIANVGTRKEYSTVCTSAWMYFDSQRTWGGAETKQRFF